MREYDDCVSLNVLVAHRTHCSEIRTKLTENLIFIYTGWPCKRCTSFRVRILVPDNVVYWPVDIYYKFWSKKQSAYQIPSSYLASKWCKTFFWRNKTNKTDKACCLKIWHRTFLTQNVFWPKIFWESIWLDQIDQLN